MRVAKSSAEVFLFGLEDTKDEMMQEVREENMDFLKGYETCYDRITDTFRTLVELENSGKLEEIKRQVMSIMGTLAIGTSKTIQ